MKLVSHHYGKARVRVMKVSRRGARHELKELDVRILLSGAFETSYTRGDNSLVVPTDTMKNTVNVLAKKHLGVGTEDFGLVLGRHFLDTYPQIGAVEIDLAERRWERIPVGRKPHPHSFLEKSPARPLAKITASREGIVVSSGIENLLVLKTTASGFAGYAKDPLTTLPETRDRIFATQLKAMWTFRRAPRNYAKTNEKILARMLEVFAENFSPSVQTTLYQMGEAALGTAPEISQIRIEMPNKHCLLINLAPFGLKNENEIFVPTDEPQGQIEGTISRE
jgi:urate oxidase